MIHFVAMTVGLTASAGPQIIDGLARQAELRFEVNAALEVRSVEADSPAGQAGLEVGDRIHSINDRSFGRPYVGADLLRRLDGGRVARLGITRKGHKRTVRFTPSPKPLEKLDGFTTEYGAVKTADGAHLRTYVSVPVGARGRRPALFFVQWVSCDSIEIEPGGPTTDILAGVARRLQMVLLRVERSSDGDSEGPGCHGLDFDTEVAHYRAAFDRLVKHRRVDRSQVVVWGDSLGSVVSPFVVQGKRIAGFAIAGGGAVSYLERMITFDRIRLERDSADPGGQSKEMVRRIRFHTQYLIRGRDPVEIERSEPDLKGVWGRILGTGDKVHYGRPYAYHRQAAARNILGAWLKVRAPVLVMYNEFDQFEAEHGHRLIARTLNRQRPGQATYVKHRNMGHGFRIYPDEYAAHRWDRSQRVSGAAVGTQTMVEWIQARVFAQSSSTRRLKASK